MLRDLRAPLLLAPLLALAGCDRGDQLGGVERAARAAFDGWDMWDTEAVTPYQRPMPLPVAGTVPTTPRRTYEVAAAEADRRSAAAAQQAYGRYCRHCHGEVGDGRIIVGESLNPAPPDLRGDRVQGRAEPDLYRSIADGTRLMIPLGRSVDPVDLVLALRHVRTLRGAPSRPFYPRKYTRPLSDSP
jgi:mono/diheme cytochrome c family protein